MSVRRTQVDSHDVLQVAATGASGVTSAVAVAETHVDSVELAAFDLSVNDSDDPCANVVDEASDTVPVSSQDRLEIGVLLHRCLVLIPVVPEPHRLTASMANERELQKGSREQLMREIANRESWVWVWVWVWVGFGLGLCGRNVLGQGAKVLCGSAQGIYPPHRGS